MAVLLAVVKRAGPALTSNNTSSSSRLSTMVCSLLLSSRRPVKPVLQDLPRRPPTSYLNFVKEKFNELELEGSARDRIKTLSRLWRSMSDVEKAPYFARYKEDLDEYQQRCSQYWAGQTAETFEQYKRDLLKYHRKRRQYLTVMREKRAGTYDPTPRRMSGYQLYLRDGLQQADIRNRPREEITQVFSRVAKGWTLLSDDEKKAYNDRSVHEWQLKMAQFYERHPEESTATNQYKNSVDDRAKSSEQQSST